MKALWIVSVVLLCGCEALSTGLRTAGAGMSDDVYNAQNGQPPKEEANRTDRQCMSDCMKKGYLYGYCKKECSY